MERVKDDWMNDKALKREIISWFGSESGVLYAPIHLAWFHCRVSSLEDKKNSFHDILCTVAAKVLRKHFSIETVYYRMYFFAQLL